ncbi:GNAT family N-acetyltransferase [Gorillibacterium massiliense]|uniref:GNAT family N-acetyltransferase n=1 Tax=Gorillibacterium massiliense TaxID=1280390 RepID=UPI0004ADA687|nr:GNAT family N-acetyltransferase [Gorillibacterium massiliense]
MKSLQSNRLVLHILGESDAELVLDYFSRNRDFLQEWEPRRDAEFYTLKTHKTILAGETIQMARGQLLKVWIAKKEQPDTIIGSASLSNIVRGAFQSCHLGYRLAGEEVRKGYMTEAVERLIEYGFQDLHLHRIEANIMPRNKASLGVVTKLGFANEGLSPKYLYINGVWEDHIHMVLLNENWEETE